MSNEAVLVAEAVADNVLNNKDYEADGYESAIDSQRLAEGFCVLLEALKRIRAIDPSARNTAQEIAREVLGVLK